MNFGDVVRRYIAQELPRHRSGSVERYLLEPLLCHWLAQVPCNQLSTVHLAAYRDERLNQVKANSVRRLFNLLRPMLDIARQEWGAPIEGNPARAVKVRMKAQ